MCSHQVSTVHRLGSCYCYNFTSSYTAACDSTRSLATPSSQGVQTLQSSFSSPLQFSLPNPRFLSLLSRPLHRTDRSALTATASFVNAISVTAAYFSRLLDGQRMHPSAPSYRIKNLPDTSFLRTCSISVVSCEIDCRIRRSTL